ncbi:MAG TPA: hypothetical protein VFT59_00830, partial [Candidatus Saccharimonadales bacterium]|nr:hypothetical protein [Candidatus Saccharimonadales bacterium]
MARIIRPRRARYAYIDRRVKKSRRRLAPIVFFGVVFVLLCGYGITSLGKNTAVSSSETNSLPSRPQLNKIQLAWPAVGQAAIGSVEDGLLAQSSHTEALRPTASMAKVITALAILERRPLNPGQAGQTYTLTSEDVRDYHAEVSRGGSVVPVYDGMVLTQYEAMQAMLIASGNNIADMLVKVEFGSVEAYAAYAQDMLRRMELHRTIVADASGYSSATVSTPSELVMIGIAALKNPVIAEIVAQPQAQIPSVGNIKNTNELLGTDGVIGIKTG